MVKIIFLAFINWILFYLVKGDPFYWGQDSTKFQIKSVNLYQQASGHLFTVLGPSRVDSIKVTFSQAFASTPQVAISTIKINTGLGQDLLVSVKVISITSSYFYVKTTVDDAVQLFDLSIIYFATIIDGIECNYFNLLSPINLQGGTGYRTQPERKKFTQYPKTQIPKVQVFLSGIYNRYSRSSAYPFKLVSELQVSDTTYSDFQVLFSTNYDNTVDMMEGYYIAIDQTKVIVEMGEIEDNWPTGIQVPQFDYTPVVKTNSTALSIFVGINQYEIGQPNALNVQYNIAQNSMAGEQYIIKVDPLSSILHNVKYSWFVIKYKTCQTNEYLINGYDCELSCPSGQYPNNIKYTCELCDISCLTCTGPASNQCSSCDEITRTYSITNKECECKDGYFILNINNPSCEQCDWKCNTCESFSTKCNTCKSNRINPPSCDCPPKFWDQGSYSLCQPCYRTCYLCTGGNINECSQCLPSFEHKSDNSCGCPNGFYEDIINIKCLSCHKSCYVCDGPDRNNCIQCDSSKYRILTGNVCSCMDGYIENSSGDCVVYTPPTCVENCKTCDSTNIYCLQCETNRVLSYNQCPCQLGMYPNSYDTCVNCFSNCSVCKGSGRYECIQCKENYQLKSGECIEITSSNNPAIKGGLFTLLIIFLIAFTGGIYYLYTGYTTMQRRELEAIRTEFVKSKMEGKPTQKIIDFKQKWKEKKEEIDLEEDIVLRDVKIIEGTSRYKGTEPVFNITSITNQQSLTTLHPFNLTTSQQNYTMQQDQNNTTMPTQVFNNTIKTQVDKDPANPLRVVYGGKKQNDSQLQSLNGSYLNSLQDLPENGI